MWKRDTSGRELILNVYDMQGCTRCRESLMWVIFLQKVTKPRQKLPLSAVPGA